MKLSRFQLGDQVRVVGMFDDDSDLDNQTGVVIHVAGEGDYEVGVQFDEEFSGGHSCAGRPPNFPVFKAGHCYWGYDKQLALLSHGDPVKPEYFDLERQEMWRRDRKAVKQG